MGDEGGGPGDHPARPPAAGVGLPGVRPALPLSHRAPKADHRVRPGPPDPAGLPGHALRGRSRRLGPRPRRPPPRRSPPALLRLESRVDPRLVRPARFTPRRDNLTADPPRSALRAAEMLPQV